MNTPNTQKKFLSNIVDYVELIVIAVCLVIGIFSLAFRTCTVDGNSMNNTMLNQEVIIVSDMFYSPERYDIIVFHQTDNTNNLNRNKPLVKRVIGVGGDTVKIDYDTWTVTVTDKNGETTVLDEDYIYLSQRGSIFSGTREYVVPEGSLFVLGDNRNESLDSRYSEVGFVDQRRVLGKVVLRVSPMSKFGTVD